MEEEQIQEEIQEEIPIVYINIILIEENGTYQGAHVWNTDMDFNEISERKEVNGRTAYLVTDEQKAQIEAGGSVSIQNGQVVVQ